jgi:hypothetical protein
MRRVVTTWFAASIAALAATASWAAGPATRPVWAPGAAPALVGLAPAGRGLAGQAMVPAKAASPTEGNPNVAGLPTILDVRSPLSTAIVTNVGGRNTQYAEVDLMADWDGSEDGTADRGAKLVDLAGSFTVPGQMLTRVAVSEHTAANGFTENIFYYGDSVGNLYVGADMDLDGKINPAMGDKVLTVNLPTVLNAFGTLNSDSQIVVTGLAVNPVADLTSFANVNGSFSYFNHKTAELLVVTFWDTGGGIRILSNGQVIHSGVLAFPVDDAPTPAAAPPGILSDTGFPITFGGAFGVAFSIYANLAGCAVDDDGNAYFQQVDLQQYTGGNIVKITSVDDPASNQDRSFATNGFATLTTLNPANGDYGTSTGPANQVNHFTNYSGTSPLFGDVVALGTGPGNVVYAAVARSWADDDDPATQATEGPFPAPPELGATPSMVISFVDFNGLVGPLPQEQPLPDGHADAVDSSEIVPGVNNYRAFALGNGPDLRSPTSKVFGSADNTLKLDLQIDYSIFGGVIADEANTVYVVSGGAPAWIGTNPSPTRGEILSFEDNNPYDRRADYIDYRGDALPNPPASGGTVGDGDSDRFDHLFWVAPLDPVTITPLGVAGLSRGFLLYLNRTRNNNALNSTFGLLPNGHPQGDDGSNGPIYFSHLDPGHQASGGDDQYFPFHGDDDDGGGNPAITGALEGGFEFVFGGVPGACPADVWNAFYLNSNGNITFGVGDTSNIPSKSDFQSGAPRIAPAWTDMDPGSRWQYGNKNTFPVQALGYAGINEFKVRFIGVPLFGFESAASTNSFSVSLWDDGTGADENANQPLNPANPIGNNAVPFDLQEGPTAPRWFPTSAGPVSAPPRADGTGLFSFDYGFMDLTGDPSLVPVLVGYSVGGLDPDFGQEANLSEAGRNGIMGGGDVPSVFEFFHNDDYDLRGEGNSAADTSPPSQGDPNRQRLDFAGYDCGVLAPRRLVLDSSGNGVLEAGETVDVAPVWHNGGGFPGPFSGGASHFTGPNDPDPTFTINDDLATYTIPGGSDGTCGPPEECYQLTLGVPSSRPSLHWDTRFEEHLAPGITKTWTVHVGGSFSDVSSNSAFYPYIETMLHFGVSEGCGGGMFCPNASIPRKEMAKQLLLAREGTVYVPQACVSGSEIFNDVPASDPYCRWIEELARRGITAGCGGGNFCPDSPVSRGQIAVLALGTLEGSGYAPPACTTPPFNDIPTASPFCPWIQEFALRGITAGCGGGNYCPSLEVSAGQMSVFMSKTFSLELYGK